MKLYNLGSLNVDYVYRVEHFLQPGETLSAKSRNVFPGGKGLNQSVAAARAGAEVIHGAVAGEGADFLLEVLASSNVDVSRIKSLNEPCGHAVIQVDDNGQNCIMLFAGTNHSVTKEYVEEYLSDAQAGDILLLQNETCCLREAMEAAVKKQMRIALNPSPFDKSLLQLPLEAVSLWFCNEIEAAELFVSDKPQEIAESFLKKYPDSSMVLTLGGEGSVFISKNETVRQDIFPVEVVDTTAAGDTFTGYFLSAVMNGEETAAALKKASKAASITVSRAGASVSIPYIGELS